MTIEALIYTRLSGYSGLTALIGTRIYPLVVSELSAYPAVTVQTISNPEREHCMGRDAVISRPRIQITAWADTYPEVVNVITQVVLALRRYSTTGIQDTFLIAEPYDLDYEDEAKKYGRAVDIGPIAVD